VRILALANDGAEMHRPVSIIVPFKLNGAKSRLSPALTPAERMNFAFTMLVDVLRTILDFGTVTVLSRPGLADLYKKEVEKLGDDIGILESELDLNDALNELIEKEARRGWQRDILIVMADLALLAKSDIVGILNCPGEVVLCPGRGGGTNMVLIKGPGFRTCYQGLSFPKHLAFSREAGLKVTIFESFRAGCDIDEPDDLAELLLHGRGGARVLLERMGFSLSEYGRATGGKSVILRRHA
jgi:2-phospho-L-lactate guanylyltransferase